MCSDVLLNYDVNHNCIEIKSAKRYETKFIESLNIRKMTKYQQKTLINP